MTQIVELKTVVTASEPDRDKKYTMQGKTATDTFAPLHYIEGKGWTWGFCVEHFDWDRYVAGHRHHFPLAEIKSPKVEHRVEMEELRLVDSWDDKLRLQGYGASLLIESDDTDTDESVTISLLSEQAAELRDWLVANVKTTES